MGTICFTVNYCTVDDVSTKIQAIRALRILVEIGLKEAKETFEQPGQTFTFSLRRSLTVQDHDINVSVLNGLTNNLVSSFRPGHVRAAFAADAERILRNLAVRGVEAGDYDLVRRLMGLLESRTWN
jgi:hypothetical protein